MKRWCTGGQKFTGIEVSGLGILFYKVYQVISSQILSAVQLFFIFCCKDPCGVLCQSKDSVHSILVPFEIIGVEEVKRIRLGDKRRR